MRIAIFKVAWVALVVTLASIAVELFDAYDFFFTFSGGVVDNVAHLMLVWGGSTAIAFLAWFGATWRVDTLVQRGAYFLLNSSKPEKLAEKKPLSKLQTAIVGRELKKKRKAMEGVMSRKEVKQ
jgi:membrane protein implicated in regulation of membrane protease activity